MKKLYTVYTEYKVEYHKSALRKENRTLETDTIRRNEQVIFASDYAEASKLYNEWFRDDEYYKTHIKEYWRSYGYSKDVEIVGTAVTVRDYRKDLAIEQLSHWMYAENFRDWWFGGMASKE